MTYIGAALLLLGAILAIRHYRRYLEREISVIEGFVLFLREMHLYTSSYLEPVSGWISGFECEALEEIGFLALLREGKMPKEAYHGLDFRIANPNINRALYDFFTRCGTGNLRDEEIMQKNCLDEITRLLESERGEVERRSRVFGALAFAVASGIAVLLI